MSKIYVFGYGSLIAASGINGRRMRRIYTESDITECTLNDHRRSLNAVFCGYDAEREIEVISRFFGITKEANQSVNGIIFPLNTDDIDPFIWSEGGNHVYDFKLIDVNSLTFDYGQPSPLEPNDRVYACIVKRPSKLGYVSNDYVNRCNRALNQRSKRFKEIFGTVEGYLP